MTRTDGARDRRLSHSRSRVALDDLSGQWAGSTCAMSMRTERGQTDVLGSASSSIEVFKVRMLNVSQSRIEEDEKMKTTQLVPTVLNYRTHLWTSKEESNTDSRFFLSTLYPSLTPAGSPRSSGWTDVVRSGTRTLSICVTTRAGT